MTAPSTPETTTAAAVVYFVLASILGAAGQYLYREGATRGRADGAALINAPLLGGVACYVAVMVLFVMAYRSGGSLRVLYPVYASTFIFGALIAYWAHGDPVRPIHVVGMFLLVAGMALMGR